MRNSIIALAWSCSSVVFANPMAELPGVYELDQGACWIQTLSDSQPYWKIASFNDHSSGVISADLIHWNLSHRIDTALKNLGVATYSPTAFSIHLYCSGGGHQIILNIKNENFPVCVTTNLAFTRFEMDSNFSSSADELCSRGAKAELLLFPKEKSAIPRLVDWLKHSAYKNEIKEIHAESAWIIVKLAPVWALKEKQLLQQWLEDPELMEQVRTIVPNQKISISGSSLRLGQGMYAGFGR